MTVNELMTWLEQYESFGVIWFVALPCLTYLLGRLVKALSPRGGRYLLAGAIYLAVLPGICMTVMLLYMIFFVRLNLLQEMNLVFHFLPVISMIATLWAAARLEPFALIPGFNRLQGLIWLVGLGFAGLLFVHKTFVGILFFARFEYLLALFVVFLVCWRFGVTRLFGRHTRHATR